ncbi:glycosyltransferase family 4 protein [Phocaeicola fibrisolvens]|uniref:glycosyltransferase family 4 protein n=1 Tax=Phocaeicola fibrisolvens TaxID=2981793 RepID=UPI000821B0C8|nr:glycosyltransferase [Phocaeicola fibrisolvens]MCU6777513.1 glycosyltransferase [Phocaeicola fibrisolvens]SCH39956.1 colanic acid biosynthesis glycosyltransferase WcaL [uncultured Bacteroides sp.]
MKILWFCNTPCCALEKISTQKGVSGGWLNTLSKELSQKNDIELHIAFYWNQDILPFEYKKIQYYPIYKNNSKNKLTRWMQRLQNTMSFSNNNNVQPLLKIINDIKPDLIHIHGTEEDFGLISLYINTTPIVLSIQGFLSSIHAKLFSGIPQTKVSKYETFFSKINLTGSTSINHLMRYKCIREKQILRHMNYIIGRTDFDKYCSLIYNPNRVYLKVNEIMREIFFQVQWNKNSFSETFTITTTISNGLYKGLETIYLTASLLKQNNMNFKWQIIGLQSHNKDVILTEKYTKLKANNLNIEYLGRQEAKSISTILQQSDLYCQTSHIENSPNSTCEAMLLGMPIIASFAGGTSSLITNNTTGILVQDGDPYVLGGAILHISKSFEFAKQLGQEARKYALNNFSPKYVIEQILAAYYKIYNNSKDKSI